MQNLNLGTTGAILSVRRPAVIIYNRTSQRGIMRLRSSKAVLVSVASFITGSIVTLLLCSSHESDQKNVESTELHRIRENARNETLPAQSAELDAEVHHHPPPATLPPYPPSVKDKAMFLSPSGYNEDAFLVIIVVSTGKNFEARKAIRTSWGKSTSGSNSNQDSFQLFFVVGCDDVSDERVVKESQTYGDILRGNFLDTYVQNEVHTVKVLLGLKWATTVCNPQYILKVNSDSFVNVQETIKWLHTLSETSGTVLQHKKDLYTGYCHSGVTVVRNPQSPYFIPENQWSGELLPAYGSGIGVVFSRDVAEKMVQSARETKMIHIDDVFIGVLAQNLNVQCQDESPRFDIAYTTMLTECTDMSFCVLGNVPAKDMFYLSQNVDHLRDICNEDKKKENLLEDLFYV